MTWLAALFLAPFTLLTLSFAVELFVGLRPLRREDLPEQTCATSAIIIPAHDEEAMIGASVSALKASGHGSRILVVADNCTDRTADAARNVGVEVIERTDPKRRGKGFALDFARAHLRASPPDIVLILDADCATDPQSLQNLIAICATTKRPCQAVNLQRPNRKGSPAVQLSTFAFFVKNVIRQRALQRLAGRAHLLGTGMAFPWAVFDRATLATDNIVEDLQMGLELAEKGHNALLVEEASVWSEPETKKSTLAQRGRWEGGFLKSALAAAPRLLSRSLGAVDLRGMWAAINLFIPPLALLVLLDTAALLLVGAFSWLTGAANWPLLSLATSVLLACLGLALAWASGGRQFVTAGGLARIPLYVLWKLPLYLGFARSGAPKDWIRTRGG